MTNKFILSSIAMDLKRVAMASYNGSGVVADRFLSEAMKNASAIDKKILPPRLKRILNEIEILRSGGFTKEAAEDYLMYSTIFQNEATYLNE